MNKKYELPLLPYDYDSLEPYIDEDTLHFHHDKHHQVYADKFNMALGKYPDLYEKPIEDLFRNLAGVPDEIRAGVRNFGGGYINHNLYWESLAPDGGGEPEGLLMDAINCDFGSFETMKENLNKVSLDQFGSGYGWLVKNGGNKLKIYSLPNQDTPLSLGDTPLLLIDVWEHAYYLKYKNERAKYLENIWNIINWDAVSKRFTE